MPTVNHPNSPNQRIEAPEVRIAGKRIDPDNGTLSSIERIYSRDHERIIGGETQTTAKDVDARASDAYRKSVTVTINTDAAKGFHNHPSPLSAAAKASSYTGERDTGLTQNQNMYTYYTLNGKDPKRTSAKLYKGSFTIRQNASGSDNYILKVRSYINGIASPVRRVDFRIVGVQGNYRNVNQLVF